LDKFRDKEGNWREKFCGWVEDILKVGVRYPLQENDEEWVERTVRCTGIIIIIIMF
jgi:hypothetical protein